MERERWWWWSLFFQHGCTLVKGSCSVYLFIHSPVRLPLELFPGQGKGGKGGLPELRPNFLPRSSSFLSQSDKFQMQINHPPSKNRRTSPCVTCSVVCMEISISTSQYSGLTYKFMFSRLTQGKILIWFNKCHFSRLWRFSNGELVIYYFKKFLTLIIVFSWEIPTFWPEIGKIQHFLQELRNYLIPFERAAWTKNGILWIDVNMYILQSRKHEVDMSIQYIL
jgi:hypothetical protein